MRFNATRKLMSFLFVFAVSLGGTIACADEGSAPWEPLASEVVYQFVGHLEEVDDQGRLLVWEATINGDVTGELKWWFVQPSPVSSTPYTGGRVDDYAARCGGSAWVDRFGRGHGGQCRFVDFIRCDARVRSDRNSCRRRLDYRDDRGYGVDPKPDRTGGCSLVAV